MPPDLRPGPCSPPNDELDSAEACLGALQQVVHPIAAEDLSRQTPCADYDVRGLTGHLLHSIGVLGGMVGVELPPSAEDDSVERRIVGAARPVLDAWHRRGLDGTVPFGTGAMPARYACGALSVEFLVHAWDYATAVRRAVEPGEPLTEYVLGLAQKIIRPPLRRMAGFDDPVSVPDDAPALDRLIAFTGRDPAGGG
ncbi:MAG: TIGR03086 family metal-binding protein [Mycobacterium sp.]|nr:TIGR03086 family metal-binding protein [Mycobacterium sp.]